MFQLRSTFLFELTETMNGIARQRNCLFSLAIKTDCYVYNGYVFLRQTRMSFQLVGCFVFKKSQIYLFDRILATSCFSAKTDTCFKITEFMFHNHKIIQTNDKVEPLPFAKN